MIRSNILLFALEMHFWYRARSKISTNSASRRIWSFWKKTRMLSCVRSAMAGHSDHSGHAWICCNKYLARCRDRFIGCCASHVTRCMGINDVFQSIEWKAIFLIAGCGRWVLPSNKRIGKCTGKLDHSAFGLFPASGRDNFSGAGHDFYSIDEWPNFSYRVDSLGVDCCHCPAHQSSDPGVAVALGCSLGFPPPLGHPVNIMVMNRWIYFPWLFESGLPLTVLAFITILLGIHFVTGYNCQLWTLHLLHLIDRHRKIRPCWSISYSSWWSSNSGLRASRTRPRSKQLRRLNWKKLVLPCPF